MSTMTVKSNAIMVKYSTAENKHNWCKNIGKPGKFPTNYVHPDYVLNGGDNFLYMGTTK